MRTNLNVQAIFDSPQQIQEYYNYWLEQIRTFMDCPICGSKARTDFIIMRFTLRSYTVKCRECDFMFTVYFRQLKKALKKWAKQDKSLDNALLENIFANLDRWDKVEKRGKIKGDK